MASVLEPIELVLAKELCKKYGIPSSQFESLLTEKMNIAKDTFPASILRGKLSSLEALVKYLRENKGMSYKEIGKLLNRNPATLAASYASAKRHMPEAFGNEIEEDKIRIPFESFKQDLSVLEAICMYLKGQDKRYIDIARILGKDERTVWTACNRATKKNGN